MKTFSKGRSEIIEQAGRKSFHMWFDLDLEPFGISIEADLSLPTKSNRKISMMTSFNEELYNSATEFLKKVTIYDWDMREFNDDMLVTVVTRMIHSTIQKLNEKDEPLRNVFVKTPKAKARELESIKEEYLWKSKTIVEPKYEEEFEEDVNDIVEIEEIVEVKKKPKRKVTTDFSKMKPWKIKTEPKWEKPFYNTNQVF